MGGLILVSAPRLDSQKPLKQRCVQIPFNYKPKYPIIDDRVRELDNLRNKMNHYAAAHERSVDRIKPNWTMRNKRNELLEEVRKGLYKLRNNCKQGIDYLIVKDVAANARKISLWNRYFDTPNSKIKAGEFISKFFHKVRNSDKATFTFLCDYFKDKSYEELEIEYYDNIDPIQLRAKDSAIDEVRGHLKTLLPKLGKFSEKYYKDLGIIREDFTLKTDYNIVASPSSFDFSYWEGNHMTMAIDLEKIIHYKKQGKDPFDKDAYEDYLITGYGIAMHELAHGLQDKASEISMEGGLQVKMENWMPMIHGLIAEGGAVTAEDLSIPWVRNNGHKFGFQEERGDYRVFELSNQIYLKQKIQKIICTIFNHRSWEMYVRDREKALRKKKEVSSHKDIYLVARKMSEMINEPRLSKDPENITDYDNPLSEAMFQINYILGQRHMKSVITSILRKGGTDIVKNQGIIMQALFTGTWCSHKAQKEFVIEHYLPDAEKAGKLKT